MGRRQVVGEVVSDAMVKTVVVRVTRLVKHPVYGRVMRRAEKFKAHDERNQAHRGDEVRIEETRPISKDKRWRLVEVLRRSPESEALNAKAEGEATQ